MSIFDTHKVVSLGELVETINATGFVNHGNNLRLCMAPASVIREYKGKLNPEADCVRGQAGHMIVDCLVSLRNDCEATGLVVTLPKVNRAIQQIQGGQVTYAELERLSNDILERLKDELDSRLFFMVESRHIPYYNNFENDWEIVIKQFPSSAKDIEEASKCLALDRHTACVFHLSRIAELGLVAIAERVGMTNNKPGWQEAITYIEGQLNNNYASMSAIFKGDIEFLRGIAAHMRDVNIAWRRRVAHIERNYNEEESRRIFVATKALMEHIATKLSEI